MRGNDRYVMPESRPGSVQRWQAQRMVSALDRATMRPVGEVGAGQETARRLEERYGVEVATWVLALGCATVLRSHLLARVGLGAALVVAATLAGWRVEALIAAAVVLAALEWTWGGREGEVTAWEPERYVTGALQRAGGLAPARAAADARVRTWLATQGGLDEAEQEVVEVLGGELAGTLSDLEVIARATCGTRLPRT